jgi:hypothetical protein
MTNYLKNFESNNMTQKTAPKFPEWRFFIRYCHFRRVGTLFCPPYGAVNKSVGMNSVPTLMS